VLDSDALYLNAMVAKAQTQWDRRHMYGRRKNDKMIITVAQYVGIHANSPDWTPERASNALKLLDACARLSTKMESDGIVFQINPKTGSCVSGETYGGFRPQDCLIGAPHSAHKNGEAVDIFDHENVIDNYLIAHQQLLEDFDLYIEASSTTPGWSHWSTRRPASGHRIFFP
jgi:hypothetical protein